MVGSPTAYLHMMVCAGQTEFKLQCVHADEGKRHPCSRVSHCCILTVFGQQRSSMAQRNKIYQG